MSNEPAPRPKTPEDIYADEQRLLQSGLIKDHDTGGVTILSSTTISPPPGQARPIQPIQRQAPVAADPVKTKVNTPPPPGTKEMRKFMAFFLTAAAAFMASGYLVKNSGDTFNTRNGFYAAGVTLALGLIGVVANERINKSREVARERARKAAVRPQPKPPAKTL